MKMYQFITDELRSALNGMLVLTALVGCHNQSIEQVLSKPPTQRVAAITRLYLGITADQISIDTVLVNGVVYPVNAFDTASFHYDSQQRLIRCQRTQTFQAYGRKVTLTPISSAFLYQGDYLQEGSLRFPLDSTQHRVLSYTKKGYSIVNFDSLRLYSSEGFLLSALQTSFNPAYPTVKYLHPNRKATLESGNMTRLDIYDSFSGDLNNVTRYFYDNQHFAPLATFTFLGETSRNALLRKTVIGYYADGAHTTEYVYTNQYDGQGRLIRQLEYEESKNSPYPRVYTLTKYYY